MPALRSFRQVTLLVAQQIGAGRGVQRAAGEDRTGEDALVPEENE
jgi:hypothetical protein